MASTGPAPGEQSGPAPSPRWRLLLAIAVLFVTLLLVLAAAQFPPRPRVTSGGGPPCTDCYSFSVVAGIGGSLTFNGTVPGPAMVVPLGAQVSVKLVVDPAASGPHSWMLVPLGGTPASAVVFAGGNTTNPSVGTPPGGSETVHFVASAPGSYEYMCGVDSHYLDGMRGTFNVTA